MNKKIAKILVGLPLEGPFDYRIPSRMNRYIQVGCRVWVQFGFRKVVGYIIGFSEQSKFRHLKPILSFIDRQPILDNDMLKLTKEFAEYYFCSWAEAIETSLPEAVRKGRVISHISKNIETAHTKSKFQGYLVHDFYLDKVRDILQGHIEGSLKKKKSIIFLVPESGYLKGRLDWMQKTFSARIAAWDRKKGVKIQTDEWERIKNGAVDIVLGTRSAIFAPLANLGLIIMEEEDNPAYKQEQGPFYHAREVAIMRSRQKGLQLILTSPTPSLEAIQLTKTAGFKLIRPEFKNLLPRTQLIDLSLYPRRRDRPSAFSLPLMEALQQTISNNGRAIIFINRKGFSTFLRCKKCGFSLKCPRCNVSLTFHYDKNKLICRYCQYRTEPLDLCPQCESDYIRYSGAGTEKIESEIHRLFPQKKILRLDSEKNIKPDNFDILIATQIILKESASLSADLVAVLQVDNSLNRLDFRAAEKTFAILARLLKLAKQRLIIQTHNREHYAIKSAVTADFDSFYKEELKFRRGLGFPPFRHFVLIGLRGKSEERVKASAITLAKDLEKYKSRVVEIFEPQPDIPAKLRGNYRWCVLLKAKKIEDIHRLIQKTRREFKKKSGIIISINVDA